MLKGIVESSIRARGLVVVLACALVAYGVYVAQNAKLDVFPDFVQPQAVIQTEAPGLSPEQVEALVTGPVESAVQGVMNLESVRSQSIQGLSIVTAVFKEKTDIFIARQMLNEQLATIAERLPGGVKPPRLTPLTSATMDLLKMGLVSDTKTPMELRTFVDWTLRPRLQAVPGIADVGVMGGEVRQLQVQVDPEKLLAHKLAVTDVIAAARKATGTRGAGFIDTVNQRVVLQSEGQSVTPQQLGQAVVAARDGSNLCLKDVAGVVVDAESKFGDAMIQGRPGVLVKLLSQYGSNTMEVTRAVEAAIAEMRPLFDAEQIHVYPRMHRPATFIENALYHMRRSLFIGAILVVVVLFLFLFNLRTAAISITAIPLSLLVAIIILDRFGVTLNTITLGGLAIAIGEVVDDAIIDVENIFRRLKENRALGSPRPVFQVVLDASLEVRSAVVYATFVVVMMFVPVLTMSGLQGRMFAPLGVAYILAILASLGVALTVTPALSMVLLPRATAWAREPFFIRGLKAGYQRLLGGLSRWPRAVMGFAVALVLMTAGMMGRFGEEFLPEFREGHFVIQISAAPGTSLPEMMRIGQRISLDLLENVRVNGQPAIETAEEQAGRAELGEDPWGPHRAEIHVELKADTPGAVQADVQVQIRRLLETYPGLSTEVLTFLGDRISETITGETANVVVNLYGNDLDALDAKADEIAGLIAGIRGAADVRVASPPGAPQMIARLRPERLRDFGFTPVEVLEGIQAAFQGTTVAQTYEGNRVFDVTVILRPELRSEPEHLESLLLRNAAGTTVRLAELADVFPRTGRYMILHDGARRRQAVTCNVQGRDLAGFVVEAKQKVARLRMPEAMYAVFAGAAEERAEAERELLLHAGLAGVGIVLLLANVFRRWQNLMLVLVNLPLAFVGGVLAVYATGGVLSIGSLVGFVTLFGITMRNSVMMISHYEHLVDREGMSWGLPTAVRGASERLMPVLMTALVTGLGLLPIALGTGEVGREIEGPMAVVILGGLITSTLLNLLILPTLALWFGRFGSPDAALGNTPAEARPVI
ncbi:MAG: efflux RND transporter permease subunit [Planctomycetes bacterium]|nr:efflux RND transporter permease subunit [Planctomycetota bacterium]